MDLYKARKKKWQCENSDCGHVSVRAKTKWIRIGGGDQIGFKVCSKCEGKVKDIS